MANEMLHTTETELEMILSTRSSCEYRGVGVTKLHTEYTYQTLFSPNPTPPYGLAQRSVWRSLRNIRARAEPQIWLRASQFCSIARPCHFAGLNLPRAWLNVPRTKCRLYFQKKRKKKTYARCRAKGGPNERGGCTCAIRQVESSVLAARVRARFARKRYRLLSFRAITARRSARYRDAFTFRRNGRSGGNDDSLLSLTIK